MDQLIMNWRFQWLYRCGLALCVVGLFWAVWASAQNTRTNLAANTSTTGTNTTSTIERKLRALEAEVEEHDLVFHLDGIAVLQRNQIFGQPLWKYLSSLTYIFLAFYISKIFDYLTGVWLKRWAERTESKLDDLLLEAMHGPVKVVAFVVLLHIGLTVFKWPPQVQLVLSKGLIVIVAFSLTYVTLKVVDLLMGVWRERTAVGTDKSFDEQLFPIVRKSIKLFIVTVAVLITAQNLRIDITGAIASLSIGGLALGLAAQDTLANLFGAVAVYMDKPFRIGDVVKIEAVQGNVESIGLRSTRIRNVDGFLVTIPNKIMGNAIITNISRRPTIRTEMNFGITFDTPPAQIQRATDILREIFRGHPKTADLIISFNKFNDSALNILVVHVWNGTDAREHFATLQELNLRIKEQFDAADIEFAFPTQTVMAKPVVKPDSAAPARGQTPG